MEKSCPGYKGHSPSPATLGPGGRGVLGLMFAWDVPLASQSPYPIIVYFLASYRPHLSHFLENVIFAIPTSCTFYLCILTLSKWFQAAECFQCDFIFNFKKQKLSDFLTENLPILNPYLPPKSENLRPHSSKSIENATPF